MNAILPTGIEIDTCRELIPDFDDDEPLECEDVRPAKQRFYVPKAETLEQTQECIENDQIPEVVKIERFDDADFS